MRYAYYPGCSLHSTAKEYDISTRAISEALGIELVEIPGWTCCGATSAHSTSELLSLALPVRNLLLAQEMGLDVLACCAACYSRFKTANRAVQADAETRAHVDQVVGRPYAGDVRVRHFLDVLINDYGLDALREKVNTELAGLRVAAYYGCLLVRPPEVVAFDDPEEPTTMDNLTTALGAEAVDWPYKVECCGGSLGLTRTDIVLKLSRDILQEATDAGADCLMVACPLCQSNLDLRQMQINRQYKTHYDLPILYFTQLVGLALGMQPRQLGLDKLITDPGKLLKAKAIA